MAEQGVQRTEPKTEDQDPEQYQNRTEPRPTPET